MKHDLSRPCKHCPFRKDIRPYLRHSRVAEILGVLGQGGYFACHETTEHDEETEETVVVNESQQCAGALILLAREGTTTKLHAFSKWIGMPTATLDMEAPVYRSYTEMLRAHRGVR